MIFAQKDFEIDEVLCKPLMAHLSTVEKGEPRDSPVWFLWEDSSLWIFGTSKDSFVKRLRAEPKCAVGIVEYPTFRGLPCGHKDFSHPRQVKNPQPFCKKPY